MSARRVAVVVVLIVAGCSSLPPAELAACGDGVVEPDRGEDCDRSSDDCGAPETALACRLRCTTTADCPATAVCGREGACAVADGTFALVGETPWTSRFLLVGDVDGDRDPELVGVDDVAVDVRVGQVGSGFGPSQTLPSFPLTGSPILADLTGDGVVDVALSVGLGTHVLSSAASGAFEPTFQPSTPIGAAGGPLFAGVLTIDYGGLPVGQVIAAARVPFGDDCPLAQGCDLLFAGGGVDGTVAVPRRLDFLAGSRLQLARIAAPALLEIEFVVVLPFIDDDSQVGDQSGLFVVRSHQSLGGATVDPVVPIAVPGTVTGATITDLDGNGELDVVVSYQPLTPIGAAPQVAVALSRGSAGFDAVRTLVMRPFGQPFAPPQPVPRPIGWGDLDGDGVDELLVADGAWLLSCAPPSCSGAQVAATTVPWTEAAVGDVNGDGHADLVGSRVSGSTVDVRLGTRFLGLWNDASFTAPGQVRALRLADFDGNQVSDIAVVSISSDDEAAELAVAFGQLGAPLTDPVSMGTIGQSLAVEPMFFPAPNRFDLADDLILAFDRNGTRSVSFMFGAVGRRMVAPFLPDDTGVPDSGAATVEAVVPIQLDGDVANEVLAVVAYRDTNGNAESMRVRGMDADDGGDLSERVVGTLPLTMFADFDFAGTRWATVPAVGSGPVLVIGAESGGRVVSLSVTGCPAACAAEAPRLLQTAMVGRKNTDLAVLDLDGDGALDLVVLSAADRATSTSEVLIWRGGIGEPERIAVPGGARPVGVTAVRSAVGAPARLVVATVAVPPASGGVLVAEPDPSGRYPALVPLRIGRSDDVSTEPSAVGVKTGDVDGDGLDDLLIVSGPDPLSPRELNVYVQGRVPGGAGIAQQEVR